MSLFNLTEPSAKLNDVQKLVAQQRDAKIRAVQLLGIIRQGYAALKISVSQGVLKVWAASTDDDTKATPQQVFDELQTLAATVGSSASAIETLTDDLLTFLEKEAPGSTEAITAVRKSTTKNLDGSVTVTP